jgi:hypothetical protein
MRWICGVCGESNDPRQDVCSKCNFIKGATAQSAAQGGYGSNKQASGCGVATLVLVLLLLALAAVMADILFRACVFCK